MRSRYFLALLMGLSSLPALATAQIAPEPVKPQSSLIPLEGAKLTAAYRGKTVEGIYKRPRERTGTNKFTERFNADGTTHYREGQITDKGQWNVRGNIICFRYDGELSGDISCFNIFQTGTCLYAYNPRQIGRDGYPVDDNQWSAKTINRGDVSSCEDLTS